MDENSKTNLNESSNAKLPLFNKLNINIFKNQESGIELIYYLTPIGNNLYDQ